MRPCNIIPFLNYTWFCYHWGCRSCSLLIVQKSFIYAVNPKMLSKQREPHKLQMVNTCLMTCIIKVTRKVKKLFLESLNLLQNKQRWGILVLQSCIITLMINRESRGKAFVNTKHVQFNHQLSCLTAGTGQRARSLIHEITESWKNTFSTHVFEYQGQLICRSCQQKWLMLMM